MNPSAIKNAARAARTSVRFSWRRPRVLAVLVGVAGVSGKRSASVSVCGA
jgi:hypothetical protein